MLLNLRTQCKSHVYCIYYIDIFYLENIVYVFTYLFSYKSYIFILKNIVHVYDIPTLGSAYVVHIYTDIFTMG